MKNLKYFFMSPKQQAKQGIIQPPTTFSASIYLFKVNNINTTARCEICSKLTIKTPKRRH